MKKTLIALAVLGATAGVAHAQSNVTVYGIVDTGFVKESDQSTYMQEKINNRIGFRGVEDMGAGLKATFELEKRFDLFNGRTRGNEASGGRSQAEFDGAANVGLAGNWGAVRFGRMNEISTETLRTFDPFQQYGVAGMFQSSLRSPRISDSVRYDSPNFRGFSASASFTNRTDAGLGTTSVLSDNGPVSIGDFVDAGGVGQDNHGYAVGVKYYNGPIGLLANYNKAANTDKSFNWNLAGSYAFGPAKVALAYEQTKLKAGAASLLRTTTLDNGDVDTIGVASEAKEKNWLLGVSYKIGAGTINASYNHRKSDLANDGSDATDKKYSLGYTHDLSKRTAVYLDYSHTTFDSNSPYIGYFGGQGEIGTRDTVNAVQLGMTHKF